MASVRYAGGAGLLIPSGTFQTRSPQIECWLSRGLCFARSRSGLT